MALSRRAKLWTVAGIVVVLAAAGGGWAWKSRAKGKKGALAGAEEEAFAEVSKGRLETKFRELGDVTAKSTVDVASKVSGRVIDLLVSEGARVKAGQKLAVVQPGKTGAEKFLPSEVVAPIGGVVLAYVKPGSNNSTVEFIDIGDYVTGLFESPNPTYLMTIADMRTIIVKLRINEMDVLKLAEGDAVEVVVDAIPGSSFPAHIAVISPQAEKESRGGKVFRVEVSLDKPDPRLRTGMTARVDAVLEKRDDALRLPLTGLFEEKGAEVVYFPPPQKDGKARQALVKTGMRTELEIEVLDGLKPGDKLLTEKPVDFDPVAPEELRKAAEARGGTGAEATGRPSRAMRGMMRRR
ncbi:MAG: efflux RND transporter periplasmic adaptor subunit [Elusimicrobia bacterium]|nr:efflux RND transporter periplasmic adaptor subunit [Elusimicrobiota bacterium]